MRTVVGGTFRLCSLCPCGSACVSRSSLHSQLPGGKSGFIYVKVAHIKLSHARLKGLGLSKVQNRPRSRPNSKTTPENRRVHSVRYGRHARALPATERTSSGRPNRAGAGPEGAPQLPGPHQRSAQPGPPRHHLQPLPASQCTKHDTALAAVCGSRVRPHTHHMPSHCHDKRRREEMVGGDGGRRLQQGVAGGDSRRRR